MKSKKWQELAKEIKKTSPAGAYAFCGPETFLKGDAIKAMKQALVGNDKNARTRYAVDTFTAGEIRVGEISTMVSQSGLFGGDRLILIENIEKLSRTGKKDQETWLNVLRLAGVNPIILLSAQTSQELSKRSKFLKKLLGATVCVDFWHLYPRDAERWVTSRMKGAGLSIEPGVAAYFIEHLGSDLHLLAQEIEKISLLFAQEEKVTLAALKKQIRSGILGSAWECVQAAMSGRLYDTMERLQSVRREESAFSFAWKLGYSAGNALDDPGRSRYQGGGSRYKGGGGGKSSNVPLGAGKKRILAEMLRGCYEWEGQMKSGRWLGAYDYIALEALMVGHSIRTERLR